MTEPQGMTYKDSGVDYDAMDPFKRAAQLAAQRTSEYLRRHGLEFLEWTRGESVQLARELRPDGGYRGWVHEGLGTRNLIADAMFTLTGREYHGAIGYSALAVGLNDAATLGVRPCAVTMHLAVGSSSWFDNERRSAALIAGWVDACQDVGCTWTGGETPTLRDILLPGAAEISCAVDGSIYPANNLIDAQIPDGASIVLLGSSGIHDNGLTMARDLAARLPKGYLTTLDDGRTFGNALLDRTVLYGPVVEACQRDGFRIHYGVNITGHGWRKLMRSTLARRYVVESVPEPQPIFRFIQEQGKVTTKEMYGNYNMGAGFALFVPPSHAEFIVSIARQLGVHAFVAGYVQELPEGSEKELIIEPLGLRWSGKALAVR
jgi:phosphoribosylformylglycinamidine cyclo-ligase